MSPAGSNFTSFAVIPAAGKSRRMGRPKLLLPWGQSTVIETVLAAWQSSQVDHVVIVVDQENAELASLVANYECEVVRDAAPPDMKASIRCALSEIARRWSPQPHDVWLLAPADFPTLDARWIDALLETHDPANPHPLVPTSEGRRGHPVLFPWPLAAAIDELPDNEGVNRLLVDHPPREVAIDDASMLAEMNTPEEYDRLRQRFDHR